MSYHSSDSSELENTHMVVVLVSNAPFIVVWGSNAPMVVVWGECSYGRSLG